jgi:hypothetical protein
VRELAAIRTHELETRSALHYLETFLMQQPVMMPARQYQVIEAGLATLAPVVDMVGVHVFRFTTARKTTAAVPCDQRAAQRRGNGAGLAAHVQYLAFTILQYSHP